MIYEDGLGDAKATSDEVKMQVSVTFTGEAQNGQLVPAETSVTMDTDESVTPHLHVRNLTRPFTMGQLKELLSKYGPTVDNRFWIDNVKSHCYVTVSILFIFLSI